MRTPGSGQPVLLMADGPTTGGRPRIATVIAADTGVADEAGPGDWLAFRVCAPVAALCPLIACDQQSSAAEAVA